MITQTNIYCDASDELCGAEHICTRLADHDGDHYDAVTERRWHNTGQTYGRSTAPRLADLRGIDPDFTGGDTTEEWLAKQRGEA